MSDSEKTFPLRTPMLFGLPSNADSFVQSRVATHLQDTLRQLGTDSQAASAFDRDIWSASLSPLLGLWAKLTANCDGLRQYQVPRPRDDALPVDAFVAMEVGKAKALLRTVDESLGAIGRLVRGTELLGATTKAEGNALLQGGVPAAWTALWDSGPEAPAPWIKQAVARMVALQGWAQQLEGGGLLRGAVRLNELLNPGFFLTALRQQTARVSQLPMDALHLVCALSAAELGDTALSFEVDGLLLQGASCAAPHGLAPLADGAGTFAPMPPLHLAWVATDRRDPYALDKSALISVYENQTRESLLSEVRLTLTLTLALTPTLTLTLAPPLTLIPTLTLTLALTRSGCRARAPSRYGCRPAARSS